MKEFKKSNRVFAEFMKFISMDKKYGNKEMFLVPKNFRTINNNQKEVSLDKLKFHSSWEWLMAVVEKIETLFPRVAITIEPTRCFIKDESYADLSTPMENRFSSDSDMFEEIWTDGENRRETAYKAVLEFIEWYNENK